MRRIEELAKVTYRDGNWKRRVVEYWLWCDETTTEVCKVLKISRPLLNYWHRWHFRTREVLYGGGLIHHSKRHIKPPMQKKTRGFTAPTDAEKLAIQEKEIGALQSALKASRLSAEAMSQMIDIAEKEFKIEIRKKSGAKQWRS